MKTARILSIAALATFASVGAQAAYSSGDLYGTDIDANFTSTRTRAEVRAEAVQAVANFKNFYVAPAATQPATVLTRAAVREEARIAIRAHEILSGDFS